MTMTNPFSLPPEDADKTGDAYREPPQNVEAEQALLGAILINNEAFYKVSEFLSAPHFFDPLHAKIFEIAGELIREGKVATPITLKTFLDAEIRVGNLTIPQYLARLASEATTIINAADFGRVIYDLALRRQLILLGEDTVNLAYDAPVDVSPRDQIEELERELYKLAETGKYGGGFEAFSTALTNAIDMANKAYQRSGHLSGIATGLGRLDQKLGGLQASDLIILAGRPGMGKTALATNIAFNVAKAFREDRQPDGSTETIDGGRVAFFSLEMSCEQLATRIISEQTEISSEDIRKGVISPDDFAKIVAVSQDIQSIPLFIDDTGGLAIAQMAARARRMKRQQGLELIVVDYLQLLTGSSRRSQEGRVQEITEITTSLKALAKELDVPIIALSQLSRQVESRDDKRPQLADLRESGSIEQDADVVMFVYREAYYMRGKEPKLGTSEHEQWQDLMEEIDNIAEVIVGKQRHGPTGTVKLSFEGRVTRFADLAEDQYLPTRYE